MTLPEVAGDNNGLRLGVPEIVRLGMDSGDMPKLAGVIVRALTGEPEPVAAEVAAFRRRFSGLHYML